MHKLRGGSEGSTQYQAMQVHTTCLFAVLEQRAMLAFLVLVLVAVFFPACFGSWKI